MCDASDGATDSDAHQIVESRLGESLRRSIVLRLNIDFSLPPHSYRLEKSSPVPGSVSVLALFLISLSQS